MESWIKENYEKVAVGGAAVIALAVGASILFGGDDAAAKSAKSNATDNNTEIESFIELSKTLERRTGEIAVDKDTTEVFVGQDLYAKQGSNEPVDLRVSAPVHPGIPNSWWIKYDLDPGFVDAPERDPDEDGFSNEEEHTADSSPIDDKSHPELHEKLLAGEVDAFRYRIRWSEFAQPQITLRYLDVNGVQTSQQAAVGDVVFKEGPMMNRFKLGERTKANDDRGREQEAYTLLDQSPLKKGRELTLLKRGPAGGSNEFSDLSATLKLEALGQGSKSFKVEEGEKFSLPYDAKATSKPYRLKEIKPESGGSYTLLFEYTDSEGELKTFERQGKAAPAP